MIEYSMSNKKKIFCTAVNCMDGRVQLPVIEFLKKYFKANYVDMITEPGPNLILSEGKDQNIIKSIDDRLDISINKHDSVGVAIVGHSDCAGNPSEKNEQNIQTKSAIKYIKNSYNDIDVIGLWIDKDFNVIRI